MAQTRKTYPAEGICFKEDRSELDDRARVILRDRLKLLRANPAIRIGIILSGDGLDRPSILGM